MALYEPGGQLDEHAEEPGAENLPVAHAVQVMPPAPAKKVFGEQPVHDVEPSTDVKYPAAQLEHAEAPAAAT